MPQPERFVHIGVTSLGAVLYAAEAATPPPALTAAADAAIAAALKISVRTAQTHLTRVYRKLAVSGRHERPAALSHGEELPSDTR